MKAAEAGSGISTTLLRLVRPDTSRTSAEPTPSAAARAVRAAVVARPSTAGADTETIS